MRAQAGFVSYLWLVVMAGLVLSLSIGLLMAGERDRENRADVGHRAYLRDAAARLAQWYDYRSGATGAQAGPIDMALALAEAGITPRFGLQAASSNRLSDGLVSWHVMALWLPDPHHVQGTAFDPATGAFTQGTWLSDGQPAEVAHAVFNGHASQLVKFSESQRRLRTIASRLENMFTRLRELDPVAAEGRNWFRAVDCASPNPGELPCYDGYRAIDATAVPVAAGVSSDTNVSAWGAAVEISNLADSSTVSPYYMSVRTNLPWGGVLRVAAQEP
ncbi:MAG: hypothetical protein KKG92_07565 [Gammaproteobacteria bacterium]|nr:hypothetical protein [Gammaproteobacteria bacterium]